MLCSALVLVIQFFSVLQSHSHTWAGSLFVREAVFCNVCCTKALVANNEKEWELAAAALAAAKRYFCRSWSSSEFCHHQNWRNLFSISKLPQFLVVQQQRQQPLSHRHTLTIVCPALCSFVLWLLLIAFLSSFSFQSASFLSLSVFVFAVFPFLSLSHFCSSLGGHYCRRHIGRNSLSFIQSFSLCVSSRLPDSLWTLSLFL